MMAGKYGGSYFTGGPASTDCFAWSSRRGCCGRSGCPDARDRIPARAPAAAPRTGRGRRPHPPPPRSSGRGCSRSVRVPGCSGPEHPLAHRISAANWSRAAAGSPANPVNQASLCAGGQGIRVLRSRGLRSRACDDPAADRSRASVVATVAEVVCDPRQAVAVGVEVGLGVRQQRGEHRPGRGPLEVGGNRCLDQFGGCVCHPAASRARALRQRDGLHQPVNQDQPVPRPG